MQYIFSEKFKNKRKFIEDMKRRIIQLGASTQVVSLPKSWATRYKLKAGDELEVKERGKQLQVTTEKEIGLEKATLDVTNMAPLHNFALVELYIKGVDEIEITSQKPELIAKTTEHPIPQLIGYEVIEQSKNRLLIKDVVGIKELELATLIRRLFLLTISAGEEILKSELSIIPSIDLNINKFAFLCLRILNKRGADDYRHTPALFYIITELEAIGDEYKKLAEYMTKNKLKLDGKSKELLEKSNKMLRDYYEIFFKFNKEKAAEIEAKYRKLVPEYEQATKAKPSQLRALIYAENIANRTIEMMRTQLTISL